MPLPTTHWRWRRLCQVLACAASLPAFASPTQPVSAIANADDHYLAFTHATLIPTPGQRLENATLVIKDGKIVSISESNKVPDGAREIHSRGKTIYPGFIDPYTDFGQQWQYSDYPDGGPHYNAEQAGAKVNNRAIHAEMNWADHFQFDHERAQDWHNNGFTSVQTGKLDGLFQGMSATVSLIDLHSESSIYAIEGAHLMSFDKGSSEQEYPNSLMGSIALIRQTLKDAQWYQQQSSKSIPQLSLNLNQTFTKLLQFNNQRIIFDPGQGNNASRALQLLQPFHPSPVLVGNGLEFERLESLKQTRLILPLTLAAKPPLDAGLDISLKQLRHWERSPGNLAAVAAANIPFAITQHGIDPLEFWNRITKAVEYGLPKSTALAALTTVAAEYAGVDDFLGQLQPGFQADLVIATGDLFAGAEIESLYLKGRPLPLNPQLGSRLSGQYQLSIDETDLTLVLSQDQGELSAQLESGERLILLDVSHSAAEQFSAVADLTELGLPGLTRLTLHRVRQGLFGNLTQHDGQLLPLAASYLGPIATSTEPEPVTTPTYLSRLTRPNRAFGTDAPLQQERLHIRGATLWTAADDGIIADADLLIDNGVIRAIGENLTTPEGFDVLDAQGKHLTPGFIDEHSHIAIRGGVNEASDSNTAEVRIGDVLDADDIHIYRSLAGGVTTAQLLHGSANVIGGQAQVIKLRWGESDHDLKFQQAPASIKFALGENVKQSNWGDRYVSRFPQTRMGVEAYLEDQFEQARKLQRQQQAYQSLSRNQKRRQLAPRPNDRLEALIEILNGSRNIHVHSYVQSEILMLLRLSQRLGFHVQTFTHILEGYKVADEMASYGTSASTFSDWWAYKFEVYDAIPHNACLLLQKGVNTSINSDSADLIRKLNQEAAKSMMYCGMSAEQALKMITINPARQLKIDRYTGSLETGKQADLVLWDQPPMSVYARVESTWVDGVRRFDRQRDRQLQRQAGAERQALIQKLLLDDSDDGEGESLTPDEVPLWHCDSLIHQH
ncbi:amidohydrolase family protein [Ferrimonas sp. SCSIO 43195]|uniref:amidohydrolase family protein n=1 Tax=Ferrimonas sp. SCSIO 43195 TaxID=2822844 RepID=UPI00207656DA|nr:amidohydrolase family protein [Ferrimonas sp. SCSIO 43195]USD36750.1 amidohydrolase family protein [Ferrimonas sp. SCSIO 43195]